MSEESKLEYLREKINQEKRTGMISYVLGIVGVVGFLIGVNSSAFDVIIMGAGLVIISLALGVYSDIKKNRLMEQLREMVTKRKRK